ncbi:hypothetical protein EV195_10938 [Tenacibaculum skagerrakense]|uniref:Cytoskeletal protein CcmA (Bactofilin family) n=1 Tax=Tenacibaculum skagerrakense TaxID=186571 RepID=A0A4R2NPP7_9FLAO|nr:hypothetical protein [Tenacibaculum skagerrakense]TCP23314.1 hypothetical protein EV195_10938 [Tenacibaculum skagerrakense]
MFSSNTKVKAGALQYVLVIAIIILIILFSFIQLIQLQQKLATKNVLYQKAISNTVNGFKYLSKNTGVSDEIKFSESLNENNSVVKSNWGAFDIVKISSKVNKETFEKIGMMGNINSERKALYLTDNFTPLVVVGNTRITGTAHLPKRGVKSGNIAGNSYYGSSLVYGAIKVSNSSLPKNSSIKQLTSFTTSLLNKDFKDIELRDGEKLAQSFKDETLLYKDYESITLQDISLKGNIIIQSLRKIIVTKETDLQDIIIIAPEIEIQSGVKATFQAFATKRIQVGRNVALSYPSCLILNYKATKIEKDHHISVEPGATVKGGLYFLHEKSEERNLEPQIKLDTNTKVFGEVFCEGNTELLGEVIGEVSTNNFITKQKGSTYINHIYNGVINAKELSEEYVGLTGNTNKRAVCKWLY